MSKVQRIGLALALAGLYLRTVSADVVVIQIIAMAIFAVGLVVFVSEEE